MDNTAGGLLCKRMQDVEYDLGKCTDLRVKMAEMAGTPLGLILTSNNPWGQTDCMREDCVTCGQGGEKFQNCTKRNLIYESRCVDCNPEEKAGKQSREVLEDNRDEPSIYIG